MANNMLQQLLAWLVASFGIALITVSFFVPPKGVIDPTALTAFGEALTFAGALIGIHFRYHDRHRP